jgi:hypothetical protein
VAAPPLVEPPRIPIGPDGIEYLGGAEDLQRTGPSRLAIDPAGGFHLYDPMGRRIWSFTTAGTTRIDTAALDVRAVETLAAGPEHMVVVEVFFAPQRHRVHRIDYDGTLLETIEIPGGFRLADGLTGVLTAAGGEIVLELELGGSYGVWDDGAGAFERTNTLTLGNTTVTNVAEGIEINGNLATADLKGSRGGMRYLGTASDGTVVVVREDVLSMAPRFEVVATVEWYSSDGALLGSARAPLIDDHFIDQAPGLAMAPDGRVYALVAREDAVEVIELERRPGRITS